MLLVVLAFVAAGNRFASARLSSISPQREQGVPPIASRNPRLVTTRHGGRDRDAEPNRRCVLCGGAAAALAMLSPDAWAEGDDPARSARPRAGDLLVFFEGDRAGQAIKPADLKLGGPPALAWPMDPNSKTLRDGSRFNQVLLIRLDPSALESDEKPHAAEGIVGFSAICTHAQCTVAGWVADKQVFQCPCHQSRYDPKNGARVVFGPAPRPLPALPLKLDGGSLLVAGPFIGRIGMARPGMG
jgi:rieske iron-sulfur protein